MDDAEGTARVIKQWGDSEPVIKVLSFILLMFLLLLSQQFRYLHYVNTGKV